jgi:hypothetical protein
MSAMRKARRVLEDRRRYHDALPADVRSTHTRPGSLNAHKTSPLGKRRRKR